MTNKQLEATYRVGETFSAVRCWEILNGETTEFGSFWKKYLLQVSRDDLGLSEGRERRGSLQEAVALQP